MSNLKEQILKRILVEFIEAGKISSQHREDAVFLAMEEYANERIKEQDALNKILAKRVETYSNYNVKLAEENANIKDALIELLKDIEADKYNFKLATMSKVKKALNIKP